MKHPWKIASRALACLALVVPLLAISLNVNAQTLSLRDAQLRALQYSRQLRAQDNLIDAAREQAVAAGQLPDPTLRLGVDNLPVDGSDRFSLERDFMTMRRIGLMQEMTSADKRALRAERYIREAEKSHAEKAAIVANIERDTALAWFDRYYAETMRALIAEQAEQARLAVEAAQSAYRTGRGSQADVYAAQSAVVMIADRASENQRRLANADIALERWIGGTAGLTLAAPPATDSLAAHAQHLETRLRDHPDINVLNKQEEIADTEARLAQANKHADWTWELAYQQRGSAYSNMVSIGVSIPLQWDQKNRQNREVAAKLALVDQARAQRDEMLRNHIAEIRGWIADWENGRERRARYERELLPLAQQRTQATLTAYRGEKASLGEVLAARRDELDTRLQALQLDLDNARLWTRIQFILPDATLDKMSPTKSPPIAQHAAKETP